MRECTEAELHINGQSDPDSKFFKPHKNSSKDLALYYRKLKCLDTPKIEVQGDYNSPKARSLALIFEKCNSSTFTGTCQSEEAISEWLVRKFIILNMNQMRFSTQEFDDDTKIVRETKFIYVPITSRKREDIVF